MSKAIQNLSAGMLVTGVLGSIHAFSVFITPLETILESSRAQISLIYSGALVCLTIVVLTGHKLYAHASPAVLVLLSCGIAAVGLLIAASLENWWLVFVGYSVLFGGANGLGYGYVLQLVARLIPERKGFAMGAVTAAYALGATLFAKMFALLVTDYSAAFALQTMACVLIVSALIAVVIFQRTGASYTNDNVPEEELSKHKKSANMHGILLIWAAYGCAVFSGLMALGHATGIAKSSGATNAAAVAALMLIALGNACGGFIAGWLADRWSIRKLLFLLPAIACVSLFAISFSNATQIAIVSLALVGFCYGALIAIYPVYIAELFGENGPAVYGRVFTAWGLAGLAGPWLAGKIFDVSGAYVAALVVAAVVAAMSSLLVTRLATSKAHPAR